MQKLLASDGTVGAAFGQSVSFDGDTALIGAPGQNGSDGWGAGSAYVFTRNGTTWTQQAELLASDNAAGDYFGWSVSISKDIALIGAYGDVDSNGSAYVFTCTGNTWTQQAKLLHSNGEQWDDYGVSVSLDGDTALIGAPNNNGSVYVFTRNGTTWTQQAKLLASDGLGGEQFGCSVALNGNSALIGAFEDDYDKGSAYIFTRTGTTWAQQAKLLASDGAPTDNFGYSVSLDNGTALIGAYNNIGNGNHTGAAYVFTHTGTTWTQQAKLLPSNGVAWDYFGWSVSLSDDTALIGAYWDADNGFQSGSAYVFTRTDTTWTQQAKLLASDGAAGDALGRSVSLAGDTAFIGAPQLSNINGSGLAYVFIRESGTPNLDINLWGGIGVNADIKNHGTTADVTWSLEVKGSIFGLIHKSSSGVLVVQGGESRWVSTGPFLGIGPFTVVAKANEVEKTAKGIVLLFYVIILT